jgi:hypothetical protein
MRGWRMPRRRQGDAHVSRRGGRLGQGPLLAAPRAGLSEKELAKALKPLNAKSKGRFTQNNIHVIELPPGIDDSQGHAPMKKNPSVQVRRARHGAPPGGHRQRSQLFEQLGLAEDPGSCTHGTAPAARA